MRNSSAAAVLLLLVLMPALSFAQSAGSQSLLNAFPPWAPLVALAIIIGYSIAGLAYMLSTVFRTPELSVWAKTEVAEVTASASLVLIMLIALSSADAIFAAATGSTPMQASLDFTSQASDKLFNVFVDSMWLSSAIGTLTGAPPQYAGSTSKSAKDINSRIDQMTAKIKDAKPGSAMRMMIFALYAFNINYYPFSGANVFLGHFGTVQSLSLTSAFIAVASNLALDFIRSVAIPLMVPLGLFFSVFSVTRKMGRTLMAFGVGLYLFLPASVLIAKSMYDSAYKPGTNPPEIPEPSNAVSLTKALMQVQMAEIALTIIGSVVSAPTMTAGQLFFLPACIGGAAVQSVACMILAPVCFVIYLFICMFFTRPMFDFGGSMDVSTTLLSSLGVVKAIVLSSILGAGVPAYMYVGMAAPMVPSLIGLVSTYVWGIIPGTVMSPNMLLMVANVANAILAPIANLSGFLSHYYLDQALASKLTDITLDFTPYVLQYAVPVMLIPLIMIIVTVTAIRSISPAIGGEIQILGLSELI
ncbi:Uncharacterised protein [uncultured archaeon]|nr:Uncharacterised protein [uncultured archaeon]